MKYQIISVIKQEQDDTYLTFRRFYCRNEENCMISYMSLDQRG
jgi:hypothetical protein